MLEVGTNPLFPLALPHPTDKSSRWTAFREDVLRSLDLLSQAKKDPLEKLKHAQLRKTPQGKR